LRDLERELKEGPAGGLFMGKMPGRADIMLEFPMSMVKHRNWVDLKSDFPELGRWLERVYGTVLDNKLGPKHFKAKTPPFHLFIITPITTSNQKLFS
jgi:hypothetical protein